MNGFGTEWVSSCGAHFGKHRIVGKPMRQKSMRGRRRRKHHEKGPFWSCNHLTSSDSLLLAAADAPDHLASNLYNDAHLEF